MKSAVRRGVEAAVLQQPAVMTDAEISAVFDCSMRKARDELGDSVARPMTIENVLVKSWCLLAVVLVGMILGWFAPKTLLLSTLIALVLLVVNARRKTPSRVLVTVCAGSIGCVLGGVVSFFETATFFPGIAVQIVLASICTLAVGLGLFAAKRVRSCENWVGLLTTWGGGYAVFALTNLLLAHFADLPGFLGSDIRVKGIPLAAIVGLAAAFITAQFLVDGIAFLVDGPALGGRSGRREIASRYSWLCGLGVVFILVWIYIGTFLMVSGRWMPSSFVEKPTVDEWSRAAGGSS